MAQSSGTSADMGKVILPNNLEFDFFNQLKRNVKYEEQYYDIPPYIPQNAPNQQFEKDVYQQSVLQHSGEQILKRIPLEENKSRLCFDNYNGRNLNILNTLKYNSKRDYPDIITPARQVLGKIA